MKKTIILAAVLILIPGFLFAQNGSADIEIKTVCNIKMLEDAVSSYVAAQRFGEISKMTLASDAVFMENMEEIPKDKGLWNKKLPIAFHRSYLDPVLGKSFTEIIVTEGPHPYVIGTRLLVEYGEIVEIDSMVTDKGDWYFNADRYLKFSKKEDWSVLPEEKRRDRDYLLRAANVYLDLFYDNTLEAPWGIPCARLEGGEDYSDNGMNPRPTCNVGYPEGEKLKIVDRKFLVDIELGVVHVFCRFGEVDGMPDSHLFRIVDGKYRFIHTLSVNETGYGEPPATF